MTETFKLLFGFWADILDVLDSVVFSFYGVNVTLLSVIFSLICIFFIVSVLWKGARA